MHGALLLVNTPAWGGVWMFFAIGGFLAAYGFDRNSYPINKEGLFRYYTTRFVKVLLPTWIFLSIAYIISMNDSDPSLWTIIRFLTCTFNGGGAGIKNVGASWYVFITMWLYLFAPILYKCLLKFEKKHQGKEFRTYLLLFVIICFISMSYKVIGTLVFDLDYYTWMYANVLGSIDLFLIGMIGCRSMRYLPTNVSSVLIRRLRITCIIVLVLLSTIFTGWIKELSVISPIFRLIQNGFNVIVYRYIGPQLFSTTAIALVLLYSYTYDDCSHKYSRIVRHLGEFCNIVSPYTFMFYLWHSIILAIVANKLTIENKDLHYFCMLAIGLVTTGYMAYLMTNMNNGIIKQILNKKTS